MYNIELAICFEPFASDLKRVQKFGCLQLGRILLKKSHLARLKGVLRGLRIADERRLRSS